MPLDTVADRPAAKQAMISDGEAWIGQPVAKRMQQLPERERIENYLLLSTLMANIGSHVRMFATYEPDWGVRARPRHYVQLRRTIEESGWILDLHDDWDREGSVGYDSDTVERATNFLEILAHIAERAIPIPAINPADEGSIDLFWQFGGRDLLLNVPAEMDQLIAYYGEDERGGSISGDIPQFVTELPSDEASAFINPVIAWLHE